MWRTHEYDYEDEGETEHFAIPYLTDNGKLIVFDTNGYGLQVVQNVLMMPTDDYTALENAGLMPDWEIVYGTVVIPSSPLLQHFIVKDKTIIIDFAQDTISPTITEYYTEDN